MKRRRIIWRNVSSIIWKEKKSSWHVPDFKRRKKKLAAAEEDTLSELDCKIHCINTANCSVYTYYQEKDSLYHQLCFLQSELLEPTHSCEGQCVTGPSDCSAVGDCDLEMNGETSKSVMLTDTIGTHSITVTSTGLRLCALRILAVGGGGGEW